MCPNLREISEFSNTNASHAGGNVEKSCSLHITYIHLEIDTIAGEINMKILIDFILDKYGLNNEIFSKAQCLSFVFKLDRHIIV